MKLIISSMARCVIKTLLILTLSSTVTLANASWLAALGKVFKGADEAAGVAKGGAAASSVNEIGGAAKTAPLHKPGGDDSFANFLSQHPWATTQLAKCVANLEPALTKSQAIHSCHSRYQQCVDRQRPKLGSADPVESCVQEANR